VSSSNDGVFVLGATNQPWDLDPALRRPGRFDRTLLVVPPDRPARQAILDYHLRRRPVAHDIDLPRLADRTTGLSGADLRLVCEAAAQRALEASLELDEPRPILMDDLAAALRDIKPSTRAWFEMARNFVMFANGDGTYDDLLHYMRSERLL
jgi:SpoVK/Ycf46/Vps4 family AAA+-type ATPase